MSDQVEQGDLCAHRRGGEVGEENRTDGFIESDFSLRRKLRQRETGKSFRDRAYLEDRVRMRGAVRKDAALSVVDDADSDAASGRRLEQAVFHHRRELGVERLLQIVQRNRGPGREFGCSRSRPRVDTPRADVQSGDEENAQHHDRLKPFDIAAQNFYRAASALTLLSNAGMRESLL